MSCSMFEYLSNKNGKELQSLSSQNIYLRQMQICRVNHDLRLHLLIKLYVCHYIQAQNALLQCIILCVYHHTHHTQIWLRHIKSEVAFSGVLKPNFKKSGLSQHCRAERTRTSWWSNKPCFFLYTKETKIERGKILLTLHSLSQFVTSFLLVGMKNSVYPKFLWDLNEDSGILQWPIGRKMFQKLEI